MPTLNEVVKLIAEITGKPLQAAYAPGRVGDVKHSLADIEQARTRLGYKGEVSFREGLKRTIAWYAERAAK